MEFSVVYAVSYIWSETNHAGVNLEVSSSDQSKVYLNGQQVYHYRRRTYYGQIEAEQAPLADRDPDVVGGLELKVGLNVLVFKIVSEVGDWQASLRLTDAGRNPLKGIRVMLDPEKQEHH
jgi:hypothetical protein